MNIPPRRFHGNHIMPDRALTSSRVGARPMPSKRALFQRPPEIINVLLGMDASHLDRQGVEQLFGVGPRRARQLMAGLAGIRAGKAAAVSRLERRLSVGSAPPGPRRRRTGPDPARAPHRALRCRGSGGEAGGIVAGMAHDWSGFMRAPSRNDPPLLRRRPTARQIFTAPAPCGSGWPGTGQKKLA